MLKVVHIAPQSLHILPVGHDLSLLAYLCLLPCIVLRGMEWRLLFTRIFLPIPQRSWWTDNMRDIGLLCAFFVAFFLDIGTRRRWDIPKHGSQSGWAKDHIPPAASFMFDFMAPPIVQPQTLLEMPYAVGTGSICAEAAVMDTTVVSRSSTGSLSC